MTKTKTWKPIQLPDPHPYTSFADGGFTSADIESDFLLHGVDCCGIREFSGIQTGHSTRQTMIAFMYLAFYENCSFSHVIFSENNYSMKKTGEKLAAMIRRRGLGTVTRSETIVNPNSDNLLTVWLWAVNWKEVKKQFVPSERKSRPKNADPNWYIADLPAYSSYR